MSEKRVPLTIGTHTWTPNTKDEAEKILDVMRKYGIRAVDSARSYGLGASETTLGQLNVAAEFQLDTKAATGVVPGSAENILQHAKESLEALQTAKIRTYFLHAPDEITPVEVQMESIQILYKQGMFEKFGLSNFTAEQVLEYHNYASSKGYVLPTVYQSSYSIAVRLNESRLFPTLRKLNFSIQAYSPMAGGLLAKTPEYLEQGKGKWDPETPSGKIFRDLYYKPSYLSMLDEFGKLSSNSGIARLGLAYRWVRYHSILKADLGDEMILGSVTAAHLEEAKRNWKRGRSKTGL